ncbi:DUF63 family protein [Halobacteriales archaeon Cl-PHB]
MQLLERYDIAPETAWFGGLVAGVITLAVGAVVFTRTVFWGFIWRYFWGPIHADATGSRCAAYFADQDQVVMNPSGGCDPELLGDAVVAEPGYTITSEIGYMIVLIYMLVGVYFLLNRMELRPYKEFLYALVPFMLFGGAFRVVEDSFDAAREAMVEPALSYPLNTLLISPVIYGTVFLIALAALLGSKWLSHREVTETYHYPLAGIGATLLVLTLGYLLYLSQTTAYVSFHPIVLVVVIGLASLLAVAIYLGAERWAPAIVAGTGLVGLIVLWGHAIDGVANVVASDWTRALGLEKVYGAKHPLNRYIVDFAHFIQPESVTEMVGDSWPFLAVKLVVATAIVALFDEQFVEDSPRYSILLLGAIIAVGLGPGSRDMLRVTFGI